MELSEKKSRPIAAKLNHWTSMDFNLWQRRNGCFFENSHVRIFEIQLVLNWHTGAGKPRVCNPKSSVVIFFTHLTLTRTLIAEAIGGEFEIKHRNQVEGQVLKKLHGAGCKRGLILIFRARRARELVWETLFDHICQKCEGFSNCEGGPGPANSASWTLDLESAARA